ncbi:xanthine dehydrogenase accessory protein XdhC [Frigidibacter albus]|uniref:Xanthine dehydrogenase accessory protein XdhC n=1 Tax=Frigidibacter albus TaxID=1465486 RepID=A0A6L8VG17_9RHOB|nr:xanthine dehydrogenase accessory protein XdhC [Frigidibacter albus]MZQ88641.1 xanthine dehydrogenase accessory protein XdhC [Frigidibacter albus]NBE30550.1 xanthine dehydrogenase accessory protein XdhC [Frigidibacter albus]GGH49595.1 xanthine dehydrogenase accessory protein XdhC [Frigidibacter albus]
MSFDAGALAAAVERLGPLVRVLVAGAAGSVPREAGAEMLVSAGAQEGTIGGGTLEWQASLRARELLASGAAGAVSRVPLGPALGQCCGGAVTLAFERLDAARLAQLGTGSLVARALDGSAMPLAVVRLLARARGQGALPRLPLLEGSWLVERAAQPARGLWIWGAGHVGRALVSVLAPLPDLAITWVDTGAERFPEVIPAGVTQLVAANPAELVAHAPREAEHLILTFSHQLDLELCHRLLGHGFAAAGLIGSASKRARFHSRLRGLGHADAQILRIACPIGDPALGKHPQAIAVGVAAALLKGSSEMKTARDRAGGRAE